MDSSWRYRVPLLDYPFVRHYTMAQETPGYLAGGCGNSFWEWAKQVWAGHAFRCVPDCPGNIGW